MRVFRNLFLTLFLLLFFSNASFSETAWLNDMRTLFLSNNAIIYGINIRTFNSSDNNNNGIIEEELGEQRGTFLNAIDKLDELVNMGVNTVHLLPVTPVGKVKAFGTAGSLYAASSFNELNPQLKGQNSKISIENEMKNFVSECHKRKLRVIVDLPCCGSYDLYLKRPELFKKDKNQNPIIPADWTDVRLFETGDNSGINSDVYALYQGFVDLMVNMDVDGIVANAATMKPYAFWKKLIDDTKAHNPEFLFLAQASKSSKSPSEFAVFTPYDKLLNAGFDGYFGEYSNLKNWVNSNDLYSAVKSDIDVTKKFAKNKRVLGNFATHDEVSPILINGPQYSKMIIWLNATLPLNPYYVDGFPTGDTYLYPLANKKASKSFTDDEYYFVHRGQLDIFNFSRRPLGKYYELAQDFIIANKFRAMAKNIISDGNFVPLKTTSTTIFAYARSLGGASIIVMGNLNSKKIQKATVSVPKLTNDLMSVPIKLSNIPKIEKGKIVTELAPFEVQVLFFNSLEIK